ncbi:glycosyltransferase [Vibrio sp. S9_S30]|uniref:glycosyltransferase family 2 protein n=1 Tax=Vibrio sp. S9_S30 TaxID=2720226 RepID=UPI0016804610|nr:glycosyltransferase [Vibrio sp. S9_S30]MBD1556442.1 glycosyltransferase [Vibrio sp. S9_S30]
MPPISVIVITLNEETRVANLLKDLSQQTYRNFEVILVDSNSDDETMSIASSFNDSLPELTVHNMGSRGVGLGRNTGASMAKHNRLLFLDADVRLQPSFLHNALEKLSKSKLEVAGVYMGAKGLPFAHKAGYTLFNIGLFATQFVFPTAVGACIFSTKRVHADLAGFDEQIILCEDCDYVKRASQTWRFRFLPMTFEFDPRRLDQDGLASTGWLYLKANVRRFFFGEMRNQEMEYKFGHYNH